jgi:hypothetical protein
VVVGPAQTRPGRNHHERPGLPDELRRTGTAASSGPG